MRYPLPETAVRRRAEYELWLTDYMQRNPAIEPARIVEAAFAGGWSAGQRRARTPEELDTARDRIMTREGVDS